MRVALSAAVAAAAALPLTLAVPFATGVAHATAVSPTLVYAADLNRDGPAGLYKATMLDPTNRTAILADDGSVSVRKALLSPDGTRIAVLADFNAASASDSGASSIVTMNLDGSNRHTLVTEFFAMTETTFNFQAIDGFSWKGNSQVVYSWFTDSNTAAAPSQKLRVVSASGGASTDIPGAVNMRQPAASPDGSQIVAVEPGSTTGTENLTVFPSSSASTKHSIVTGATTSLYAPAWSPDASSIAFARDESDDTYDASEVDVVRYDSGSSTWGTAATAVAAVKGSGAAWIDDDISWTDNATLLFERVDDSSTVAPAGFYAPIDLWTSAFDSGTSTWGAPVDLTNTSTLDEYGASTGPVDITAPNNVTVLPFVLNGTSITVRWTPNDADFSHVVLKRTDMTAGTPQVTIGNKYGTSYVDTNLSVTHTYAYTFQTVDGAGNTTTDDGTYLVTATYAPKIVAVTPTALGTPYLPFLVTWGHSGQPAGTTYDVDYTVKSGATWALGATYHFATGTTAKSGAFTKGVPGQTYYFRATVHDTHGNGTSTSWSGVNVPLDQKNGTFSSGWTTISNSRNYWLGSIAATSTNGKTFTITPTSKSVTIIGTKCAACGKFAVYVDGHYRGTISTYASTTKFRQALWTGINVAIGKHTIKLVAVLAAHQTLQIDGVADPR